MSAECKRLSTGESAGPNCGCREGACALDLPRPSLHRAEAAEAEIARLREQGDSPTSDEIAESALWLDAVSEAFPDFDFSGCYDFDDLRKHMIGQASRLREERDAARRHHDQEAEAHNDTIERAEAAEARRARQEDKT